MRQRTADRLRGARRGTRPPRAPRARSPGCARPASARVSAATIECLGGATSETSSPPSSHAHASGALGAAAPRKHHAPGPRRDLARRGVVGIDDREVSRPLAREEARLGRGIVVEAGVPVEVVGGDVREHRHVRVEEVDRLELERRDLAHEVARPLLGEKRRERRADVAREDDASALALQDFGDPGRRRGLAVGAGDRDPAVLSRRLRLGDPPRDLDFRKDGHASFTGGADGGHVERHARGDREPARRRRETRRAARRRRTARRGNASSPRPSKSVSGRLSPTVTATPRSASASASARPLLAKPSTAIRRGRTASPLIAASGSRARAPQRGSRGSRSG